MSHQENESTSEKTIKPSTSYYQDDQKPSTSYDHGNQEEESNRRCDDISDDYQKSAITEYETDSGDDSEKELTSSNSYYELQTSDQSSVELIAMKKKKRKERSKKKSETPETSSDENSSIESASSKENSSDSSDQSETEECSSNSSDTTEESSSNFSDSSSEEESNESSTDSEKSKKKNKKKDVISGTLTKIDVMKIGEKETIKGVLKTRKTDINLLIEKNGVKQMERKKIKTGNKVKIHLEKNYKKITGPIVINKKVKINKIGVSNRLIYTKIRKLKSKKLLHKIVNVSGKIVNIEKIQTKTGKMKKVQLKQEKKEITLNMWNSKIKVKKNQKIKVLGVKVGTYLNEMVLHLNRFSKIMKM